jgi:hypothetical protein
VNLRAVGVCLLLASAPVLADHTKQTLTVDASGSDYVITVPISKLALTMPKGRFAPKDNGVAQATSNPRYFHFVDPVAHIIVSGWFESDRRFKDLDTLWKDEARGWRKRGLPEPKNVAFGNIGKWQAIAYDVAMPKATDTHLRVEWLEAGTWIDLHLSTAQGTAEENRKVLQSTLEGFKVTVKP